jgi:hypothetical protein
MPESEITRLRRARLRVHHHLANLEPMVEGYRAKLAKIEARIQEIAPEFWLSPRFHKPNSIFRRGELTRFALDVLREAGEPLPIRVIAVRALAIKGIDFPDAKARHLTRKRLRAVFLALDKRGVTVRVGEGMEARRGLAV